MLNYQIKKYIGSYAVAMGGVDCLVFTGGIGEHDAQLREAVCEGLDFLGIRINVDKNQNCHGDVCDITGWRGDVCVLVIATDEELMIARETKQVVEE